MIIRKVGQVRATKLIMLQIESQRPDDMLQKPLKPQQRPTCANRLFDQFKTGSKLPKEKKFWLFSPDPLPDLSKGAGRLRFVTTTLPAKYKNVESSSTELDKGKNVEDKNVRNSSKNLRTRDGFNVKLSEKSTNHLVSKHGHIFGIDDPLPPSSNQKPTLYPQTRTRVNNGNRKEFQDRLQNILLDPETNVYRDVDIRGIKGRVYHCAKTDSIIAIHTEGEFAGQIKKSTTNQFETIRTPRGIKKY